MDTPRLGHKESPSSHQPLASGSHSTSAPALPPLKTKLKTTIIPAAEHWQYVTVTQDPRRLRQPYSSTDHLSRLKTVPKEPGTEVIDSLNITFQPKSSRPKSTQLSTSSDSKTSLDTISLNSDDAIEAVFVEKRSLEESLEAFNFYEDGELVLVDAQLPDVSHKGPIANSSWPETFSRASKRIWTSSSAFLAVKPTGPVVLKSEHEDTQSSNSCQAQQTDKGKEQQIEKGFADTVRDY